MSNDNVTIAITFLSLGLLIGAWIGGFVAMYIMRPYQINVSNEATDD